MVNRVLAIAGSHIVWHLICGSEMAHHEELICLKFLAFFVCNDTIWDSTIEQFNMDSKAECDQLDLAHVVE